MTSTTPPQAGSEATPEKGSKAYETALLRQRYSDLRAAVIRDGLPLLVARIEAAELRTLSDG
jgi:hypothetical protein